MVPCPDDKARRPHSNHRIPRHRHLFGELYAWAGKFLTVELAKGETAFAPAAVLHGWADQQILPVFQQEARRTGTAEIYALALAKCWGELNFLHPFREGNGRSTQIFVAALTERQGWSLDWAKVARDQEIAAAQAAARTDYAPYSALILKALGRS